MLQLLIIRNHSCRIIGFLRVYIVYLLDIFETGPEASRPTQDGEFCDLTRPDPSHGRTRPTFNSELGKDFHVLTALSVK